MHIRRPLEYPIEGGLGAFLPPPALNMLAVDYQDGLLQRLSDEVRGKLIAYMFVFQDIM
jgi:Fe-Mn family superoxide dismutase